MSENSRASGDAGSDKDIQLLPDSDSSSRKSNNINSIESEIPEQLRNVLLQFSITYLTEQPEDVINFAIKFFRNMQKTRAEPSDSDSRDSIRSTISCVERMSRRQTVYAESYEPDNESEGLPIIFPKTDEQRLRLQQAVKEVLLFRSLQPEQLAEVLDAMFERQIIQGECVIHQGDDGDNFYVIETGKFRVIKNNLHVHSYTNTGYFGELALLYNMPRAASVFADSDGLLWALDRSTFRRIVLKSAFKQRKMYESLLEKVPMLKALQDYERMNLADALVSKYFKDKDVILKQGDAADGMYFVEKGTVIVAIEQENGEEIEVAQMHSGDYFGELSLVTHRPRIASIYSKGDTKVAYLNKQAFDRILGFLGEVLKRNVEIYEQSWKNIARKH